MKAFLTPMQQLGEFEEISRKIAGNRGMLQVTGCIDSQKSHFIYSAASEFENHVRTALQRKMVAVCDRGEEGKKEAAEYKRVLQNASFATLIITYSDLRAKELYENYRFFDREVLYFPAKDLIFFQADIHSNLLEQQRLQVLKALVERRQVTIITTMAACMNQLVPFEEWMDHIMEIDSACEIDTEELKKELNTTAPVIFLDAALLLEEEQYRNLVDEVWVVSLKPETQLERLINRNGYGFRQAKNRIASQMSDGDRVKQADAVIDNNGTMEETLRQVDALLAAL